MDDVTWRTLPHDRTTKVWRNGLALIQASRNYASRELREQLAAQRAKSVEELDAHVATAKNEEVRFLEALSALKPLAMT
jgi:hypothetical protein